MGLALRRHQGSNFLVVGHDREPGAAGYAEKVGAVSRIEWNLPRLCAASDALVLALPLSELRETLALVAPHLKPGAVVLDTAPLKGPVMEWAAQTLAPDRFFIGANPILNPERLHDGKAGHEAARADLFQDGLLALVAPASVPPEALKLGNDLAHLMGAAPFFLEAAEHDALMAGADALPSLLAAALSRAVSDSPAWTDLRKLADRTFATGTAAADLRLPAALRASLLLNQENVLRALDGLLAELGRLRDSLAASDGPALEARLAEAAERRARWLLERKEANWEAEAAPEVELPTSGEVYGQAFGLANVARRRAQSKRESQS